MRRIGPRLWKTGLAVALSIFLIRLSGLDYEVFGAVAAALAVAPSASRSLRTMTNQITAHLIGGLIGSLAMMLFGPNPLVIGVTIVLVLWLCQHFGFRDLAPTVATVTLFVMAPHAESVTAYSFWRLLAVLVGCVVGTAVNAFIVPPNYFASTMKAIDRAGAELDRFVLSIAARLDRPGHIQKAEILASAARVEAQIAEARRLSLLLGESIRSEQGKQKEVIDRAIRVLSSLLERIQVLHKAALFAQAAEQYEVQLPEIRAALEQMVAHRKALFASLLVADTERVLGPALAELEHRFESSPGLPTCEEQLEPFFRLYRMRSSVSHMANRLGRLWVAKEGAVEPVAARAAQGYHVAASDGASQ